MLRPTTTAGRESKRFPRGYFGQRDGDLESEGKKDDVQAERYRSLRKKPKKKPTKSEEIP